MTGDLITEADFAAMFGEDVTEQQVAIWRRARNWPSTKVGRRHWYTEAQVAEILRMQEHRPKVKPRSEKKIGRIPGQTDRSARKRAS